MKNNNPIGCFVCVGAQPIRVNDSKNWFQCMPCRHDNVTSPEFPDDVMSSAEIHLSVADNSQMTSDSSSRNSPVKILNGASSNDNNGKRQSLNLTQDYRCNKKLSCCCDSRSYCVQYTGKLSNRFRLQVLF